MKFGAKFCVAATALLGPSFAAAATVISPADAINGYCEPLLRGESAAAATTRAHTQGFTDVSVGGRAMLMRGEMLMGLSETPRVCAVQAPKTLSPEQGFALADAWAKVHPGAQRVNQNKGPDGSPVRAWSVPAQHMALVAVIQTNGRGDKVVLFLLQPV